MNISIKELNEDMFTITAEMIAELLNYYRKLNNAPSSTGIHLKNEKKL